jgi:hypothetical protein
MASTDNKAEVERKPKRKQARRQARRKDRQATKQSRVGALDKFQAQRQRGGLSGNPEVDARRAQAQAKMDQMGGFQTQIGDGRGGPMPPQTMPPQPQPQPAVAPSTVGTAIAQAAPVQEPMPVAQPPQMLPPDPMGAQVDPAMQPGLVEPGAINQPMPPAMSGEAAVEPMPVDQMGGQVDPATGEYVSPNTMPPVTPEGMQAQADMDQAAAQGNTFNVQTPPVAPPEQFYNTQLGQGGMQSPRDIERVRRKRLALLSPKVQQLRPAGRGMPQIRYQGGPAFQGSFEGGGAAGWARPAPPQPQAQPGAVAQQIRQPFRA